MSSPPGQLPNPDVHAALSAYEHRITADPTAEEAYTGLAELLLELNRLDEALTTYRRGLAALPESITLLNDLGSELADRGDLEAAAELWQRALTLAPSDSLLLFNLGTYHDHEGRLETAIDYYRRSLQVKPDDLFTAYNLGLCYQDLEQYADAIDQFARVIEYGGERPEAAHLNLGVCFSRLGQIPMAEAAYRKSVEVNPDYFQGWFNLACICDRQHRPEEALAAFREAARCDPDHEETREWIEELIDEQS